MEQSLETRLPIYLLMALVTILGTYLFMNWTADDGLSTLVKLLYSQQKIKTFSQQLKIIVTTSYYFALITIIAFSIAEVYKFVVEQIKNVRGELISEQPLFTTTTKNSLFVIFHTFLVFIAFFYYLLRNDGDDLSRRYINLLPFWFLASMLVYLLGAWLSRWARLKLYINGIIMSMIMWGLIIGELISNGFIHSVFSL